MSTLGPPVRAETCEYLLLLDSLLYKVWIGQKMLIAIVMGLAVDQNLH